MALIHNLLGSIGAIADIKINNIEKDKIIEAKIVKVPGKKDKDKTVYYVCYQQNKYMKVYSKTTTDKYNVDDTVYIRIPDGDMTNRKVIEGKVINYLANESANVSSDTSDYQLAIRANKITTKKIESDKITTEEGTGESEGIIYDTIKIEGIYESKLDYTNINDVDINFNIELDIENTKLHISDIASIGFDFYHWEKVGNEWKYTLWNPQKEEEEKPHDIQLDQGYTLTGSFINDSIVKLVHTELVKLNSPVRSIDRIDLIIKLQRVTRETSYTIGDFVDKSVISNIDFKLYKEVFDENVNPNNYIYPYNIQYIDKNNNINRTYLIPMFTKDNQDYLINPEAASVSWFWTDKKIIDEAGTSSDSQITMNDIINNNYYLDNPVDAPIHEVENTNSDITFLEKEILNNYQGILDEGRNYLARFTSYLGQDSYAFRNKTV